MSSLAAHLSVGATVILESTTYPGTTENLAAPLLEHGSGLVPGVDFHLGYSPERIDPGNPTVDVREHAEGRVRDQRRRRSTAVQAFYDTLVDTTVPVSGRRGGRD